MAVLHGFISEMGRMLLTSPLTGFYLFVCVLWSLLVCGGVHYKTVPLIIWRMVEQFTADFQYILGLHWPIVAVETQRRP